MMTWVRSAGIIAFVAVATLFMASLSVLASFFSRSGDAVHRIARKWAGSILAVSGIRVTLTGLERIDPAASYIFMANHQSTYDIPVLLAHLPVQFRWIAKAELFRIPVFGRAMRGAGYISIKRDDRASAFQSLEQAAERMRCGRSVMIFPEGTRSRDGELQSFKKGGFVLAVDSRMPIVPVSISGTFEIMPKNTLMIQRREVLLSITDPIASSDYSRETKAELMERVRQAIQQDLRRQGRV
jgi:1-acyl-sn-glycerol-3-phosphate acyltransferase